MVEGFSDAINISVGGGGEGSKDALEVERQKERKNNGNEEL